VGQLEQCLVGIGISGGFVVVVVVVVAVNIIFL